MRKTFTLFLALALLLGAVGLVNASTSAEKQLAIDKGLAYLAAHQNADGSWSNVNSGAFNAADTGAALLAFVEQKYKPLGWNGANYTDVVNKAATYLLGSATTLPMSSPNWWGFNNGGTGLRWGQGSGEDTYITGIVLPALSRLVSNPYGSPIFNPTDVIVSGNAAVNGKTYAQVIQGGVDSFAWYQTGPASGNRYGGWRYYAGNVDSDMSTTQWAPISFQFAATVPGVTIPDNAAGGVGSQGPYPAHAMKTALQTWLTVSQNSTTGGVDYQPGVGWFNATHAGGLIVSNLFAGGGGDVNKAVAWLNGDWLSGPSGTWWGNEGHPYAMWAVYKGLEELYGTTGAIPAISNLHPQGLNAIDPGATWNWWEDYCQYLVDTQQFDISGNGYWNGYSYWRGALADAWYINILNATEIPGPAVPLPPSVLLLGSGLFGLMGAGWWRRRKN